MQNLNYWVLAEADAEGLSNDVVTFEETATEEITTTDSSVSGDEQAPVRGKKDFGSLILMVAVFAFMFFILFRGPRKQQKEQKQMRESLNRNDRVQTIGGILGTIIEIKDDEVTLKIDESTNTKMKISKNAIARKMS